MYAIKQQKFENGILNFVQILSFRFNSISKAKDKAFRLNFKQTNLRNGFHFEVVEVA